MVFALRMQLAGIWLSDAKAYKMRIEVKFRGCREGERQLEWHSSHAVTSRTSDTANGARARLLAIAEGIVPLE